MALIKKYYIKNRDAVQKLTKETFDKTAKMVGDLWVYIGDSDVDDPFPPKKHAMTARIINSKTGWIRYYISSCFPDERMREGLFRKLYSPPQPQNELVAET